MQCGGLDCNGLVVMQMTHERDDDHYQVIYKTAIQAISFIAKEQ